MSESLIEKIVDLVSKVEETPPSVLRQAIRTCDDLGNDPHIRPALRVLYKSISDVLKIHYGRL